jgi:hypothetical protein
VKERQFFIPAEQIDPSVAPGRGSCIATDLITVEGRRVGFMYREEPDHRVDSGWRFYAGMESQTYADDADNMTIYDVNTIANYDRDIVLFLDAPSGSAFERDPGSGVFKATAFPDEADE